jgi:hypothetical protein
MLLMNIPLSLTLYFKNRFLLLSVASINILLDQNMIDKGWGQWIGDG